MANILSQNEIDELLSALASGSDLPPEDMSEDESKLIRSYDFRTANKFSKDQMRTLHFIYDNFATRLTTYLSGTLRTICEVEVISIEEQTFSEMSNSMPIPVIVAIITMSPLHGNVLIEVTPVIAYEIISRLLGGAGQSENTDKAFTEIELSIMERVVRRMLSLNDDAWEKINKVKSALDRLETSSQYAQIVSSNEPIAIVTMNVKIGDTSDIINLCIPHVAVQPIAKKLVIKSWYSDAGYGRISGEKDYREKLSGIFLNLHSVFNTTSATVGDIMNTKVGDVIQIDHNINRPVTVKVEHMPKFQGVVGIQGSNYAVRITEILEEDTDDGSRDFHE